MTQHLLEILAKEGPARPAVVPAVSFIAGPAPAMPFGPSMAELRRDSFDEGLETLMPDATGRLAAAPPRFQWDEAAADDWAATRRRITILEESSSGFVPRRDDFGVDDDRGVHLLTVLVDGTGGKRRWGAIWLFPQGVPRDHRFLFKVVPDGGPAICSAPFDLLALPSISPPPQVPKGACP